MATIDRGWSWVVMIASFTVTGLLFGLSKCAGVMYTVLPKAYDINRSQAATITILFSSLMSAFGVVSGMLLKYLSTRQVVIIAGVFCGTGLIISSLAETATIFLIGYGIVLAIGGGLSIVPSRMVITQYFDKKLNLAICLSLTGSCVGGICVPPLMEKLEATYGLSNTMFIFSAILLHILPAALTFFPQVEKQQEINNITSQVLKPNKNTDVNKKKPCSCPLDFSVLSNFNFLAIVFSSCSFVIGHTGVSISLLDYAVSELHFSRSRAILLSSAISTGDLFGRLFMAVINTKVSLKNSYLVGLVLLASLTLTITLITSFWLLFALSFVYGIIIGTIIVTPNLLINQCVEPKQISAAYSLSSLFISAPILASGPLMAIVRDSLGSYVPCFYVASFVSLLASSPWYFESFVKRNKKKRIYWLSTEKEKRSYRLNHPEMALRCIF